MRALQMNVQKTLLALDGVTDAAVDLEQKQAAVTLSSTDVPEQVFRDAVADAGYTLVSCESAQTANQQGPDG